jgi:hypothetical protein
MKKRIILIFCAALLLALPAVGQEQTKCPTGCDFCYTGWRYVGRIFIGLYDDPVCGQIPEYAYTYFCLDTDQTIQCNVAESEGCTISLGCG